MVALRVSSSNVNWLHSRPHPSLLPLTFSSCPTGLSDASPVCYSHSHLSAFALHLASSLIFVSRVCSCDDAISEDKLICKVLRGKITTEEIFNGMVFHWARYCQREIWCPRRGWQVILQGMQLKCWDNEMQNKDKMEQFIVHLNEKKKGGAFKVGSFSRYFWGWILKEQVQGKTVIVTWKFVKRVANENGFWKMDTENLSQGLGLTCSSYFTRSWRKLKGISKIKNNIISIIR